MTFKYAVGIDYSMTCPAAVIINMEMPKFNAMRMMYIHQSQRKNLLTNIDGHAYPDSHSPEERFDKLSGIMVDWLEYNTAGKVEVWIEDYAFAAKGKVFHIGENTGLLKHKLWMKGIPYHVVAPAAVKKFATGKGTADKLEMYSTFVSEIDHDIMVESGSKQATPGSPFADLADAYFIAKYGAHQLRTG